MYSTQFLVMDYTDKQSTLGPSSQEGYILMEQMTKQANTHTLFTIVTVPQKKPTGALRRRLMVADRPEQVAF